MSQWLRQVQCKYTPPPNFTLFDYSKIAYPTDSSLCLKQIITQNQRSTFIPISHHYDSVQSLHGGLGCVISLQKSEGHYYVCLYGVVTESRHRITVNLQGNLLKVWTGYRDEMLLICFQDQQNQANQLVFFETQSKQVVGRGLIQGDVKSISIGPNCSISLLISMKVVAYKNQPILQNNKTARIYKQAQTQLTQNVSNHFWVEDQLIIWGNNVMYMMIKNKICQQFKDFHRLHYAIPMTCGFMSCDGCVLRIYKKTNIKYDIMCEFIDERLIDCINLQLSPQQDILAYFTPTNQIVYSVALREQIQQARASEKSTRLALNLKNKIISHNKAFDFNIFTSSQPWFAAVNGKKIQLINSSTYQQFLSLQVSSQIKPTSQSEQTQYSISEAKIRHVSIHPNRPVLAVALKKMVRLYYITFNDAKIIKQLNCSMCGLLSFNRCGSLLAAVVSGKGGAKIYIFQMNEIKNNYSLVEILTVSKKPIEVGWDSLDSKFYCFFNGGYCEWTTISKFKNKNEVILNFGCQIKGAIITKEDNIAFWGNNKVFSVTNEQIGRQQIIKATIKNIYLQNQFYVFVFADGKIGRNKNLQAESSLFKSYNLNTKGQQFQIQPQQDGAFIMLTKDLNIQYFQSAGSFHFSSLDIVGIEKKKLYYILQKHREYEEQIKNLKEQLTDVVSEIKMTVAQEQKQKQKQYRSELQDHIQREIKAKDQKTKLEQIMQKNLQTKQLQAMDKVKELQRLYQRKIAITTNKLLTEKQIGYRQKIISENKLVKLQQKHYESIEEIRKQFAEHIQSNLLDKKKAQTQLNNLKKDYEARLFQLQEQNEGLLKELQDKNQVESLTLKKMVKTWQNKYSECMSMKSNVQKQLLEQKGTTQTLKQKIGNVQTKKMQSERRCEYLSDEIHKIQKVLQQRNKKLQHYEKRIQDLEKSNEILKYRVLEVKQQNGPYEEQITKLKTNMNDLQQEYDKIVKQCYEEQQKLLVFKKQKTKLKEQNQQMIQKYKKVNKKYQQLIDRIRETSKCPIQQIRSQLLAVIDSYSRIQKTHSVLKNRADSPLGQLNRIRDHLQVCLGEAVTSSKKNEEQRKNQIIKKSHQNTELITQINTMRKRIRQLQDQLKENNLKIGRMSRGETPPIIIKQKQKQERVSSTEAHSKEFTKTKSRQTFYENSLFKTNSQWGQKRLKTEQNSRRKKSSYSMMKQRNRNGSLAIQPQTQQIEQYKKIIEQKDMFIQRLIAKIHKA